MTARPDPLPADVARLGAYLMSGSLRYALAADAMEAGESGRPARDGLPVGDSAASPSALMDRWLEDLASLPPRTLPLWAQLTDRAAGEATARSTAMSSGASPGRWLDPFPDDLYPEVPGPATRFEPRETIHLAFLAALQLLEPRECGLVVLHDVLGLDEAPADDLAAARAAFAIARVAIPAPEPAAPYTDEAAAMMRLVFSCESGDGDGLRALLAPGSTLQLVPDGVALTGRDAVTDHLLAGGPEGADHSDTRPTAPRPAGLQRLLPRRANGRLAFGVYRRASRAEPFRAHALWVVTVAGPHVTSVVSFTTPSLFPAFDLLRELGAQGEHPDL